MQPMDVVVVGGGITGTAIARALSRYQVRVLLLEAQPDIGAGTTKANSGILHAGFDAQPGTLKAALNAKGNRLYRELQDELGLDLRFTGSWVIAKTVDDLKYLMELYERGRRNGVPGLEILSRNEVLKREPHLASDVVGGLFAPTAGVMCPFRAAIAMAENAVRNGVEIWRECPVTGFRVEDGRIAAVKTPKGDIPARFVVNAAGLHADSISRLAGDDSFTIHPRKGEYILFDRQYGDFVHSVVFPTPTAVSKGILVAPTVHGNLFIGPNAQDVDDPEDAATSAAGFQEIIAGARRLVPQIPLAAAITEFAGLRATADGGDFIIRASETVNGLVHAAGIQSPGLTAAPAIAEMVTEILQDRGLDLTPNPEFRPENPPRVQFSKLDPREQAALIQRNPLYGRVICRCETVTEGEIVDAIHAPCGAVTVDGVKRRTRSGSGRCQGGFCGPRIMAILSRELDIPMARVRKDPAESYLVFDKSVD